MFDCKSIRTDESRPRSRDGWNTAMPHMLPYRRVYDPGTEDLPLRDDPLSVEEVDADPEADEHRNESSRKRGEGDGGNLAEAREEPCVVSAATHKAMVGNKRCNTKPELVVRRALREAGLSGYRLQWKKAPGRPDIAYPGRRIAIYVDGCFWHRCPHCKLPLPKTNAEYWLRKFEANVERDKRVTEEAQAQGWTVVRIWECELTKDKREQTLTKLIGQVRGAGPRVEYAQVDISDAGRNEDDNGSADDGGDRRVSR